MKYIKSNRGLIFTVAICLIGVGIFSSEVKSSEDEISATSSIHYLTNCRVMANASGRDSVRYSRSIEKFRADYQGYVIYYSARAEGYLVGRTHERILRSHLDGAVIDTSEALIATANELFIEGCLAKA